MSDEAVGYVWKCGAKRADLLVLSAMADCADSEGVVIGNVDRLHEDTGYPHGTIHAVLKRQARKGVLRPLSDENGNVYGNVHPLTRGRAAGWPMFRLAIYGDDGRRLAR